MSWPVSDEDQAKMDRAREAAKLLRAPPGVVWFAPDTAHKAGEIHGVLFGWKVELYPLNNGLEDWSWRLPGQCGRAVASLGMVATMAIQWASEKPNSVVETIQTALQEYVDLLRSETDGEARASEVQARKLIDDLPHLLAGPLQAERFLYRILGIERCVESPDGKGWEVAYVQTRSRVVKYWLDEPK